MRPIDRTTLSIGHAGNARDPRLLASAGIEALIDLAIDEPAQLVRRDAAYCRFPLLDGGGNPEWLVRAAVLTTSQLARSRTRTLIFCSAGMSRSPCIAAAAASFADASRTPQEWLAAITTGHPADVSPGLWNNVLAAIAFLRAASTV